MYRSFLNVTRKIYKKIPYTRSITITAYNDSAKDCGENEKEKV